MSQQNGAISCTTAETSEHETYREDCERSCTSAVRMERPVVRSVELANKESRSIRSLFNAVRISFFVF